MPTPALAIDSLIDELNSVRSSGRLLKNELQIVKLKKHIDAYKSRDWAEYWLYSASLFSLMGDVEQTIHAGTTGLNLTSDYRYYLHHVKTLMHLGKFSLANQVCSKVPDDYFLEPDDHECYCLFQAIDFRRFVRIARAHPEANTMGHTIRLTDAVCKILERENVLERQLLRMVDLAGDLLRERGLVSSNDIQILPYPGDGTVTINLPVSTSAGEVANLDWEYAERLFTLMPDAPATVIHVGFSCSSKVTHA